MTVRLLLDANLSPETSRFLRNSFGFDVEDIVTRRLFRLLDEEIAEIAIAERRVVISHDLDWGEIWQREEQRRFGVIMLRLRLQSIEDVNAVLARFFEGAGSEIELERSFIVLEDKKHRTTTRLAP